MTREALPLLRPVDSEELIRRAQEDKERETRPWHPREVYFELPKGYGAVPSDQLMLLAAELDMSSNPLDRSVAGSAMIEARLFSPYRTEEVTEDDAFVVNYGNSLLRDAADAQWDELERGFRHYDDQTPAIRAEVAAAFAPIYLDLLHGEITHEAREETYTKLARWGKYILGLGDTHGSYGLAYEIATLMGGLTNEHILLPATPRADNGRYRADTTHDFTYLELRDGTIETTIALELKNEGNESRQLDNARRYDPRSVVVLDANKDLSLHKDNLLSIFTQRSMTYTARRNLTGVRSGIFARTNQAGRQYGAKYKEKASA